MPTPTFQGPSDNGGVNELRDYLFRLIRDLNYMLGNLDAKNIIADSITTDRLRAGKMIGFIIQTNNDGEYPNIIFTSVDDLLTALQNANNFIRLHADLTGVPTLWFENNGNRTLVSQNPTLGFSIIVDSGDAQFSVSSGDLLLFGNIKLNHSSATPVGSVSQNDSTAATLDELRGDFNDLLEKLRDMNILDS